MRPHLQRKHRTRRAIRPQWQACLDYLREGDTLVITKLDRAACSLRELMAISDRLRERGVDLLTLDQKVDTSSAMGRMFFQIVGAFAEFEHELIRERTLEGLAEANAKGNYGGRPSVLDANDRRAITQLHRQGQTIRQITDHVNERRQGKTDTDGSPLKPVSRMAISRYLKQRA